MPERFGNYVLEQRLASGGMAELFRATRGDAPRRTVVVKRALPSVRHDKAYDALLRAEGRIAGSLAHPNVARTLDAGDVDGVAFIVVEEVDGADLVSVIHRVAQRGGHEIPIEHVLTIALGMSSGLAHVHAHGIVHRDVTPPNVMVARDGEVKLVDFGLAIEIGEPIDHEVGTARGTAAYMSPEQARGERVDARSDVFSLGVVLFELTTSKRLFVGSTPLETLRLVTDRDVPRPGAIREGYPDALERIVLRALAKAPDARYPSAEALRADLADFAARHAPSATKDALARFMKSVFNDA
jgi:serine/threonine-protein kinase